MIRNYFNPYRGRKNLEKTWSHIRFLGAIITFLTLAIPFLVAQIISFATFDGMNLLNDICERIAGQE